MMTEEEIEAEARPTLDEIAALKVEADAKWRDAEETAHYLGQTREELDAWRTPHSHSTLR
jgi:hypothetical protein